MLKLQFKKLHEDASLPKYAYQNDSGMDVLAIEDDTILPGERKLIRTGLSYKIPNYPEFDNFNIYLANSGIKQVLEIQVRPRSGLADALGITIVNSPGTLDNTYTGEIMVNLLNTGNDIFRIEKKKTKICQLVLAPVICAMGIELIEETVGINMTNSLNSEKIIGDVVRGDNGLGSSGL